MTKRLKCCIICKLIAANHMEQYRSGHNGHDWKSCVPQKGTEGSNPSCSAKENPSEWMGSFFFLKYLLKNLEKHVTLFSNEGVVSTYVV